MSYSDIDMATDDEAGVDIFEADLLNYIPVKKEELVLHENQRTLFDQDIYNQLVGVDNVVEVRIIGVTGKSDYWTGSAWKTIAGYFNSFAAFKAAVKPAARHIEAQCNDGKYNGKAGIYFTLHKLNPMVIGRMHNKLASNDGGTTSDLDVTAYQWLPIDVDPKRPSGTASSLEQLQGALAKGDEIEAFLAKLGLAKPFRGVSGNGAHLLYRYENENVRAASDFVKRVLACLKFKLNGDGSQDIDQTVFNPGRIFKLYGTKAMKGDPSDYDTHHRMSYIYQVGDMEYAADGYDKLSLWVTEVEAEIEAAKSKRGRPKKEKLKYAPVDVAAFLNEKEIKYTVKEKNDKTLYCLDVCLFDPSHKGNEAAIIVGEDGGLPGYHCFHNSCKGDPNRTKWKDIYKAVTGEEWGASVDDTETEDIDTEDNIQALEALNEKHAVVNLNGKFAIMAEGINPVNGQPYETFSKKSDFVSFYADKTIRLGKKWRPISEVWVTWPGRRAYEGIIMDPNKDHPGWYNLYKGLAVEPILGDCSLFKEHIFKVIANGDQAIYDYVWAWMADAVQNPGGARPGTALVLRGRQGTGKGTFVNTFGKIFGRHYCQVANEGSLTGRFNDHLKNALLVFADEAACSGSKTATGMLRAMITEPTMRIEPKGFNQFEIENHIRLIMASNYDWVVPAGRDERRFVVLDVSGDHGCDFEYFKALNKQMDAGGVEALLYELLQVDLSKVNLRDSPKTGALFDQVLATMDPTDKFWFERLQTGKLCELTSKMFEFCEECVSSNDGSTEWPSEIVKELLYDEFLEFCRQQTIRGRITQKQFGIKLTRMCKEVRQTRQSSGQRRMKYQLPSLERCRELFRDHLGVEFAWDEP
ncbi:DUF5906 domain-containing protein [Desulfococcus multivorans]|uniref:SF3 helicase domain-containing protein n=1 Tax=Desulfococcus multivorans DSM 2059 TaxID=1121405 RepID=S7T7L5_DESML|nr:DUF5906 domain-containing protein [Desulfococcus multivorans]AOY60481.1 uncharacterized protein Dmul_37130 [Desulfococcus multivorans]AQV02575.1 hypothetical protein B2D07_18550 [Desulfococcus multivorans]EPR32500.1 hypothetical protein dsmv_0873 [Desulfococcus multivorans DSM 2059]SKA27746.1 hypothetical protein SAMN02745446_03726 [Desulfococcus multivorans DSM 2059]